MSRTFSREDLNDEVLNPRLQRENAQIGTITASLLWNGPSDLDLHAKVALTSGTIEHIFFRSKRGTGGALDVDANARHEEVTREPVESIFWSAPPAGEYVISVENYKTRGSADEISQKVPFRVQLKLPTETLNYEGELCHKQISTCFRFSVDSEGEVTVRKVSESKVLRKPVTSFRAVRPMKVMKAVKSMKRVKLTKASKVARGKFSKVKVFKGVCMKTAGGLKEQDLVRSKTGKIVSKRRHAMGMKAFPNIRPWLEACTRARAKLGLTGFVLVQRGSLLYKAAKELYRR